MEKNLTKNFENQNITQENNFNNIKVKKDECLIVKTGSLIPNNIKYIIPQEQIFINNISKSCK